MITKERLEHLQKNGATVWQIKNNGEFNMALPIKLDKVSIKYLKEGIEVKSDVYMLFKIAEAYNQIYFIKYDELTESEEEAEFIHKYQGITRTETLSLPTLDEFKKYENLSFTPGVTVRQINFCRDDMMYVFRMTNDNYLDLYSYDCDGGEHEGYHKYYLDCVEATKENYTEACRLAKKLFLGEKSE